MVPRYALARRLLATLVYAGMIPVLTFFLLFYPVEKYILDYFAEVGLFMKHGLHVWAEITLRALIRLRTESPDIGPSHFETVLLYRYLEKVLTKLGKVTEARQIRQTILKDNPGTLLHLCSFMNLLRTIAGSHIF